MASDNAGDNYRETIIKHKARNPALSWLDDFYERRPPETARLGLLEFYPGEVRNRTFKGVSDLKEFWDNPSDSKCRGRLYVLEDLSPGYVSALGSHFRLDPTLFVRYGFAPLYRKLSLAQLERQPERQPPGMLQQLFSTQMQSEALTLMYYEVRELRECDGDKFRDDRLKWKTCANVSRNIVQIDRARENIPGLVRRNITYWSKRDDDRDGCWDALLIVDPSIKGELKFANRDSEENEALFERIPCRTTIYGGGYLDLFDWRSSHGTRDMPVSEPLDRSSLFEDTIYYWKNASKREIATAFGNPAYAASFAVKMVASSWLVLLSHVSTRIGILETSLHRFEELEPRGQPRSVAQEIVTLRIQLAEVNRLRRLFWWYIYHMKSNLEAVGHPTMTLPITFQSPPRPIVPASISALVSEDFSMIYERLLLIQKNVDSLLQTVVSATNLLETQQSSLDTKYALRLTILAIFFVPLQMTTGLFSMAERYLPGQSDSWIVASVCVPLLILVIVLAFGGVMINKLRFWWRLGKTYVQAPSAPDPYAGNGILEA